MKQGDTLEVISAEQGQLIDHAKLYAKAHAQTEQHERMYLFLIGATLQQLKTITPHGGFDALKKVHFPEAQGSRLTRAMQFAEAVGYFAKGKLPTIGNLKDGQKLLAAGTLEDAEKEALAKEISDATKNKGVMETIGDWRKKIAPKHKPTPEEEAKGEKREANDFAKSVLGWLNQSWSDAGLEMLARCDDELRRQIEDSRIELGHKLAPLLKAKSKKAVKAAAEENEEPLFYAYQTKFSETIHVKALATANDFDDLLEAVKSPSVRWVHRQVKAINFQAAVSEAARLKKLGQGETTAGARI